MKKILAILLFFVCVSQAFAQAPAKINEEEAVITTRILFVLDASGSMSARWQQYSRWEVATRLLTNIMDSLENQPRVEVALLVYGHQTSRNGGDCKLF
jgi:Ca-activated chloride channel family protein